MSANDPLFSKNDKPGSKPDDLPPELQGKTPAEIHAFYQRREEIWKDRLRTAPKPAPVNTPAPTPADDKIDLFGDPEGSINRVVSRKVNEAVAAAAGQATPAIVSACRTACRENHPDYAKFAVDIEKQIDTLSPEAQMNPKYWELTYEMVKGRNADRLVAEAEERGRKSVNPVETPTPKGSDPPKPRALSDEEKEQAKKFGMTEKEYLDSANRYDGQDGRLTLTTDDRHPIVRKKKESVPA